MTFAAAGKIWFDGEMLEPSEAKVDVLSHALHYGSGVFEGTRFYETTDGTPAIFRLREHTERLFYSASTLELPIKYTADEIDAATVAVVKSSGLTSGYIRPLAFFGAGKMGLRPQGATPHLMIACWGWGKYLPDCVSVKISKYIRIHPRSLVADAKVTGHYVNSILAVNDVVPQGYDEALLLDFDGNVAEGPGENFFLVKDGVIYTPPLGNVLAGITRKTISQLAADNNIEVVEKVIAPAEIWQADEAFFTGTAAEVTAIGSVDDKPVGNGKEGPVTKLLREQYFAVVTGRNTGYAEMLTICD